MSANRTPGPHAEGTRDRLMRLLQEGPKSVEELAGELEITLNAVRSQLTILERDGLVRTAGQRRGTRRPSLLYGLTPEAENRFSRAYAPVLRALIQAVSLRSGKDEAERIIREAGRRLAVEAGLPAGDFDSRVARAVALVEALGGSVDAEESEGKLVLKGRGCPLSEAVAAEPLTCKCMETLLSTLIGTKVEERCERGARQSCRFVISREEK